MLPELAVTVKLYVPVVVSGLGEAPLPALQPVSPMATKANVQCHLRFHKRPDEGLRIVTGTEKQVGYAIAVQIPC
jgi:hypothetical protein